MENIVIPIRYGIKCVHRCLFLSFRHLDEVLYSELRYKRIRLVSVCIQNDQLYSLEGWSMWSRGSNWEGNYSFSWETLLYSSPWSYEPNVYRIWIFFSLKNSRKNLNWWTYVIWIIYTAGNIPAWTFKPTGSRADVSVKMYGLRPIGTEKRRHITTKDIEIAFLIWYI